MSQLEYYRQDPLEHLPHHGGLVAWGITLIVFGGLSGFLALIMLAVSGFAFAGAFGPSIPMNGMAMLMISLVYVFGAVTLIWLGIGSRLGRRWVRPLMVAGSSVMAISGLVSLVPLIMGAASMGSATATVTTATTVATTSGVTTYSYNAQGAGFISGGCGVFLLMEVFPLVWLWFYGRPSVKATLEQMDPRPRWTDRCPLPVLGWALACLLLSFGLLSIAGQAVFPFFTTVLVGVSADVVALSLAAMFIAGGILCLKLNRLGWLMTFIATLILAGSYLTFSVMGDSKFYMDQIFQSYHLPKASQAFVEQTARSGWISPAVMYTFAICYILWLWKRFTVTAAPPEIQAEPTHF